MPLTAAQLWLRRAVAIALAISIFWGSFFPPATIVMWIANAVITVVLYVVLLSLQAGSDTFLRLFGWVLVGAGTLLALNFAFGNTPESGWPTGVRLMLYAFLVALYLHLMRAIRKASQPPWVRFVIG